VVLGSVAAVLLALLLAALLVPVVVAVHVAGDSSAGFAVDTRIRVLGIVRIRRRKAAAPAPSTASPAAAPPSTVARPRDPTSPSPAEASATSRARGASWQQRARRLRDRAALLRHAFERRIVRIDHPSGWIEYALEDVAETGQLYGFVCATSVLVDPQGAVGVTPLWTATDWLAADLTLALRVQPLRLALLLAREWLAERRAVRAAARAEELRAGVA